MLEQEAGFLPVRQEFLSSSNCCKHNSRDQIEDGSCYNSPQSALRYRPLGILQGGRAIGTCHNSSHCWEKEAQKLPAIKPSHQNDKVSHSLEESSLYRTAKFSQNYISW